MTNRKADAMRLVIFVVTALVLSALSFVLMRIFRDSQTMNFLCGTLSVWSPALANIITRLVTKEGFSDLKLHLHLKGNLRWYLLAFLLPIVVFSAAYVLPPALTGHGAWLSGFTVSSVLYELLMLAALSVFISFRGVGEEFGWRAYMNQKMEPLFGITGTCIIGGIIWGLWHLPMDITGYIQGYATFTEAMSGFAGRMMTLPFFGMMLMLLIKKTDSVWPAVLCHGIYNASLQSITGLILNSDVPENADLSKVIGIFSYVPMIAAGVVCLLIIMNDKRKKEEK